MNRMSWLLVVPLALVSLMTVPVGCYEFDTFSCPEKLCPPSASTTGTGTGGSGGMGASSSSTGTASCMNDGECTNNECRTDGKCMNGTCTWNFVAVESPVGTQIYGDCKRVQCDGKGNVETVDIAPKDSYVYGTSCYAPDCTQGTSLKSAPAGTMCTTYWGTQGKCDDASNCFQCVDNSDCSAPTPNCAHGRCVAGTTCNDMVKSGTESDIDCGGNNCPPCQGGQACTNSNECDRTACAGMKCNEPDCADGFQNGDETAKDCGGTCAVNDPDMKRCADTLGCLIPTDCKSGKCEAGICVP